MPTIPEQLRTLEKTKGGINGVEQTEEEVVEFSSVMKSGEEIFGVERFRKGLRDISVSITRDLINAGEVDPQGKTGKQLLGEVIAWLGEGNEILMVTDHTESLLQQARAFKKTKNKKE